MAADNGKRTFRVVNLEKYQHYRHRRPPWIKLHRRIWQDVPFCSLPDAAKAHLILIWLLATEMDNAIPADAQWLQARLHASEPVDLDELIKQGFLSLDSAAPECLRRTSYSYPSPTSLQSYRGLNRQSVCNAQAPEDQKPDKSEFPNDFSLADRE